MALLAWYVQNRLKLLLPLSSARRRRASGAFRWPASSFWRLSFAVAREAGNTKLR
jgi:hypothetical protein